MIGGSNGFNLRFFPPPRPQGRMKEGVERLERTPDLIGGIEQLTHQVIK